ncbi:heavy-metal-associated domain-containing protein [Paenimyroides aestuarii]|uniref:Cation transporter n=1 Tax=Paenimyroides aestuarii TaxID=2968490 RepID=A0ABY5NTI5_9FLAO|nr:cation transporter [Paenimyroides aestuarii]UUV21855.1 cation transporter [Paenimyroides aestuarii]
MKTLKGISLLFMAAAFMVSCKQTSNEQKENAAESTEKVASTEVAGTMQKATFQVEGMSCAVGCAKVIEGKLAKMDGVKTATVDFDSKTATVEFDDAKQNTDAIKKMVEEIADGAYKVENLTVAKEVAMVFQDDKTAQKKCCSSKKDGKSCGDKKEGNKKKDGCCSKDKKDKKATTKQNII